MRPRDTAERAYPALSVPGLCALIAVGLAAITSLARSLSPRSHPWRWPAWRRAASATQSPGVLFVYRALDTLLEKVVLLLALLGVWSLAADREWGGAPESAAPANPTAFSTFLAQFLPPIGIMLAIYMFWVGADHPGGAFQGGALLAAMWLLVMMAGVRPAPATSLVALRLRASSPARRSFLPLDLRVSPGRTAFLRIRRATPNR